MNAQYGMCGKVECEPIYQCDVFFLSPSVPFGLFFYVQQAVNDIEMRYNRRAPAETGER